tara:strand:+ start:896 stop:1147 length:252 start_codon:yes stop_codon:yes gene_type:complete
MEQVNHDFKYHAEIEYEHENTYLSLTNAMGNTLHGFIIDIQKRFYYYKDRNPKLILALENPNENRKNITKRIKPIIKEWFDKY